MFSKRNHEGFLQIDNRNSPGVGPELARGLDVPIVGKNQMYESATITCCHCGAVVVLNPNRSRPRNYCRKCDHYVCDNPWCNSGCRPFKKLLADTYEEAMKGKTDV